MTSTYAKAYTEFQTLVLVDARPERNFRTVSALVEHTKAMYNHAKVEETGFTQDELDRLGGFAYTWGTLLRNRPIYRTEIYGPFQPLLCKVASQKITYVRIAVQGSMQDCRFELGLEYSYSDIIPEMPDEGLLYTAVILEDKQDGKIQVTLVPSFSLANLQPV